MSVYNCENFVSEAINSILNQTFTDFEFLIADDCSTDSTRKIIDSFKDYRIKTIHNSKNIHLVETWNKLASYAKGKYITFQDADDVSYVTRLEKLFNFAENNKNIAVVGANFYRPFKKWKMSTQSNYKLTHKDIIEDLESNGIVNFYGTRALFRREIFNEFNGFRIFFNRVGWEDYDLFLRIAQKYPVANISDILYEYRYYKNSSSKVKKSNISFKKVFIHEIGLFLYHQRKNNNGLDGLMENGDKSGFEKCLIKLENKYLSDISISYRIMSKNQCSNKDFRNAIVSIGNALKLRPDILSN